MEVRRRVCLWRCGGVCVYGGAEACVSMEVRRRVCLWPGNLDVCDKYRLKQKPETLATLESTSVHVPDVCTACQVC